MKNLIYIPIILLIIFACEKESTIVKVQYKVRKAYSETEITYRDVEKNLKTEMVDFQSGEDVWQYSFEGEKGDIVYISTRYVDSTSSVKVQVLLDGKIYKEGSSNNEPGIYVTISGTIPY
ncbi:MAG: hypothetical protein H8D45_11375 [Bacteroidetes bacterium]|nr:hypothetical protein [Bacteroidota bacterium]MBL7105389.1 hypothetical protein [Bacteroidales bacterium]